MQQIGRVDLRPVVRYQLPGSESTAGPGKARRRVDGPSLARSEQDELVCKLACAAIQPNWALQACMYRF
jgi:hypothetical protein